MISRTWLITGVNSGFGRHMTGQLLARGDRVAGTVCKLDAMSGLRKNFGDPLWLAHLDMIDPFEIRRVVNKAFAELGKIDVIVSNAGYGLFGAPESLTDEQVAQQIGTNLLGPIQVVRAALPHLRRQGGGRIIGLSSYCGQAAFPGASLYHASKWGLEGFLDSMGQELAPFNIGVTIVERGGAQVGREIDACGRPPGNPAKMAKITIDSVDQNPAPKRIVLGSDAWGIIQRALAERLAAVEMQKDLASSTDFPAMA
jgi:NAD(P)-dependent dehydrogenase (short-subunit alcohol dehydrogenase family)